MNHLYFVFPKLFIENKTGHDSLISPLYERASRCWSVRFFPQFRICITKYKNLHSRINLSRVKSQVPAPVPKENRERRR
jgi:hypothetical protein